jgi:hypothetical protein
MTRYLPIPLALAETAALWGRQPTAEQYAELADALREQIVIDFDTGMAGICYGEDFVIDPASFVGLELMRPDVEIRSTSWTTPGF